MRFLSEDLPEDPSLMVPEKENQYDIKNDGQNAIEVNQDIKFVFENQKLTLQDQK